jgi:hypothetical protein
VSKLRSIAELRAFDGTISHINWANFMASIVFVMTNYDEKQAKVYKLSSIIDKKRPSSKLTSQNFLCLTFIRVISDPLLISIPFRVTCDPDEN